MIILKDLLSCINKQQLIKIQTINTPVLMDQYEKIKLSNYDHIENIPIINLETSITEIDDSVFPLLIITLNYKVGFKND